MSLVEHGEGANEQAGGDSWTRAGLPFDNGANMNQVREEVLPTWLVQQTPTTCTGCIYDADQRKHLRVSGIPLTVGADAIKSWYSSMTSKPKSCLVMQTCDGRIVHDTSPVLSMCDASNNFWVTICTNAPPFPGAQILRPQTGIVPEAGGNQTLMQGISEFHAMSISSQGNSEPVRITSAQHRQPMMCAHVQDSHAMNQQLRPRATSDKNAVRTQADSSYSSTTLSSSLMGISEENMQRMAASALASDHSSQSTSPSGAFLPTMLFDDDDIYGEHAGAPTFVSPQVSTRPQRRQKSAKVFAPSTIVTYKAPSHGRAGVREQPRRPPNYKTKLCRDGLNCKFGRNCWFAHTKAELVG